MIIDIILSLCDLLSKDFKGIKYTLFSIDVSFNKFYGIVAKCSQNSLTLDLCMSHAFSRNDCCIFIIPLDFNCLANKCDVVSHS